MSLQEAMASGKRFRVVGTVRWIELQDGDFVWSDDLGNRSLVADADLPLIKTYEVWT